MAPNAFYSNVQMFNVQKAFLVSFGSTHLDSSHFLPSRPLLCNISRRNSVCANYLKHVGLEQSAPALWCSWYHLETESEAVQSQWSPSALGPSCVLGFGSWQKICLDCPPADCLAWCPPMLLRSQLNLLLLETYLSFLQLGGYEAEELGGWKEWLCPAGLGIICPFSLEDLKWGIWLIMFTCWIFCNLNYYIDFWLHRWRGWIEKKGFWLLAPFVAPLQWARLY